MAPSLSRPSRPARVRGKDVAAGLGLAAGGAVGLFLLTRGGGGGSAGSGSSSSSSSSGSGSSSPSSSGSAPGSSSSGSMPPGSSSSPPPSTSSPPAPPVPTGLRVDRATSTRLELRWDRVDGATLYTVLEGGEDVLGTSTTDHFTTHSLAPGSYYISVSATGPGGTSAPSAELLVVIPAGTSSAPPSSGSSGSSGSTPPPYSGGSAPLLSNAQLAAFFGSDFNPGAYFATFHDQVGSIAGSVLTIDYPAGSSAPSAGPPFGGAQMAIPFRAGPRTKATLAYQMRIPADFQWVKGGKLPGVYGGIERFSGSVNPTNPNGWSLRPMWRAVGDHGGTGPGGSGEILEMIWGMTGYGVDAGRGSFSWPADGLWHDIALSTLMNTPGASDGECSLSIDGKVVLDLTGLAINQNGVDIDGLFFTTFFGGHGLSWSPTVDQHIDFAGFSVS